MNPIKKTSLPLLLALVMVATLFTGFTAKEALASENVSSKDTLIVAVQADSGDLNPHGSSSTSHDRVKLQVYESLFFLTYENELLPWLAESYEWVDNQTVRLYLRKGVPFQCGGEMKAEDVLFSLKTVSESPQSTVVEKIDFTKSSVIDDYTVELVCIEPFAPLLTNLSYLPSAIFSKAGYEADDGKFTTSIGTGPYVFDKWITGNTQQLVRFDDYWRGPAPIKNIIFKVIAEATNRVIELETGACDLAYDIAATDIARIEDADNMVMSRWFSNDVIILGFKTDAPYINDPKVRKAIAMAFDRADVWQVSYEGTGALPTGFIEKSVPGAVSDVPLPEYDPDGAKALLAEAGYPNGFKTSIVTNTSTERMAIAEYLHNALGKIGIDLEIRALDVATVSDTLKVARTHELYTWSIWPATGDIDYALRTFHGSTPYSLNIMGYKNEEFDKLVDEAAAELDPAKRIELQRQAQMILYDEMPVIPLVVRERLYAHSSELKGFAEGSSQCPILFTCYFE